MLEQFSEEKLDDDQRRAENFKATRRCRDSEKQRLE